MSAPPCGSGGTARPSRSACSADRRASHACSVSGRPYSWADTGNCRASACGRRTSRACCTSRRPPRRQAWRPNEVEADSGTGIGGQGQRNRLAPHAGVAHPAVLPAPRRVVETVARERESLLRRGEARAPHRGRHDTQHGEFVPFAETPGKAQSGGHGIGEDPFDVHVAAGAASRAAEMRQPSPGDAETAAFAPTR